MANRFSRIGIVVLVVLGLLDSVVEAHDLKLSFYAKSCPNAEKIIHDFVYKHMYKTSSLPAALIRLHFHDCFGCDGSVLLNSTSSNQAEKDSAIDLTLRGFDFIDKVKSLLEAECPGVVSCADIVALVARDSVVATGGPYWNVPTGRRDGLISKASEAMSNVPFSNSSFSTLMTLFTEKGLDLKDLVLLSGAHTIGIGHCNAFVNRLYNFTGVGDQDPTLDSKYAAYLKSKKCKIPSDITTKINMDKSARKFDLNYYELLLEGKGLFQSDAALITNSTSKALVEQIIQGSLDDFFVEFAKSMEKMGQIGVLTGSSGLGPCNSLLAWILDFAWREIDSQRVKPEVGSSYLADSIRGTPLLPRIGVAHCAAIIDRLYDFTGLGDQDLSLNIKHAAYHKSKKCKSPNEKTIQIVMDPGSLKTFDLSYYKLVLSAGGFFQTDAALLTNSTSMALINQIIQGSIEDFFVEFAESMEKMGRCHDCVICDEAIFCGLEFLIFGATPESD
ncbi:hem peroxidase [Dillenia turbinata]|uniref:peroxidase n=1 Tax=Dillenia turbinata TaxID=194707 RepID=A0AAN8UUG1_9MAGN